MDLPPELCNRTYETALICSSEGKPLIIKRRTKIVRGHRRLLQTSRQIRDECLPIYWACKYFTNGYPSATLYTARLWLPAIGPQALKHLRSLDLFALGNCYIYDSLRLQVGVASMKGVSRAPKVTVGGWEKHERQCSCYRNDAFHSCYQWIEEGESLAKYLKETGKVKVEVDVEEGFGDECVKRQKGDWDTGVRYGYNFVDEEEI